MRLVKMGTMSDQAKPSAVELYFNLKSLAIKTKIWSRFKIKARVISGDP